VVAATLRTPPHNLILSEIDDPAAIDALIEDLIEDPIDASRGEVLPGVLGPTAAARAFAERWAREAGVRAEREMQERIFRADRVVPPRPAPGASREVDERDRALLAAWWTAFADEAGVRTQERAEEVADRWLRRAGRVIHVWEDAGEVVALAGIGGETPHGIRIGPVYTPPERRGRGYASNLVGAVSARALAEGRRFCFLFTDLANPTSNHIYQALGYAPVTDVDQYRFA
jgi:predicted GNAT family acetyltransferase